MAEARTMVGIGAINMMVMTQARIMMMMRPDNKTTELSTVAVVRRAPLAVVAAVAAAVVAAEAEAEAEAMLT